MYWELPVIALRNTVVLPGTTVNIDVGRAKSKRAIDEAQASDRRVLLLTQRDQRVDDPSGAEMYEIGTLAVIKQVVRLPDTTLQVLIESQERVRVVSFTPLAYLRAGVETFEPTVGDPRVAEVMLGEAKNGFEEYARQNKNLRLDSFQLETLRSLTDGGQLADQIAHYATWSVEEKQGVLNAVPVSERLETVVRLLTRDIERFNMDKQIAARVKEQMDQNQREYYLREQLKAIGKELGGGEDGPAEIEELREKIEAAGMPEKVKEKALKELARLERTPGGSPEGTVVRNYLDWLIETPWSKRDEEILDIKRTRAILDEDHYGLEDVKERILEFLAVRQLRQGKDAQTQAEKDADAELRAPILCLVGPPGVGKTSLGKSVARSLNRKFVRMALGGVRDEAEIRGHRRTYIGSMPGRIIQSMRNVGVTNPVMLLDEIDKMSSDWRGDPSSAMLEVLDPEQNSTFQDHYLEVPYDLSQVMFITTANTLQTIPRPLLDRMEVIQIPGYTQQEKIAIARTYRVPRQLRAHGLEGRLEISDEALRRVVEEYTQEAGVRNLDRQISKLARKAARELLEEPWEGLKVVEAADVPHYLGVPRFRPDRMEREPQVGAAQGLAWTSVGGTMLVVEVLATPGSGKLNLTGSLGDVMKESAQAAVAFLRANAEKYGADPEFYKKLDLHVHFPDGATPKDGPSAGITIATAVASAVTGRPVRMDVAMTGEISLRGRVLPIGGVKEKLLAAHQAGIRTVIVPKDNEPNLQDIPEAIRKELTIYTVETVSEVLDRLLLPRPVDAPPVIPAHAEKREQPGA
ncbi:ATP-dependent Lon protease [Deinobacterium chartae]|uniref:Lon protease n=1 Tax=Deinobacterium chartae TaxID=521158 RepID=A0A841HZW9_9DEIO|nr:endopeptidase La [Deinobacterium chartae]MBB6098234.1 ATP-dependent Lon protease [Deinobacterium chartae]